MCSSDLPDDAVVTVAVTRLAELDDDDLLDLRRLTGIIRLPTDVDLDAPLQPRGHRLLRRIPRLPETVAEQVVEQFGRLPSIMRASLGDLVEVEGVGEVRARELALAGGDDYELCFTVPAARLAELAGALADVDCPVRCIGVLEPEPGVRLVADGRVVDGAPAGFDHFSA